MPTRLAPPVSPLRAVLFYVLAYGAMPLMAILYFPWALVSPRGARAACTHWAKLSLWLLKHLIGVTTEIRGRVPHEEVLIAAKHQSFLDIVMIWLALPRAKFIFKRELFWTPVGLYALRVGCVPVNRGKRGQAIRKMVADVAKGRAEPGQLVIYSQGTRVAPGVVRPYKVGTAVLYRELGQPCVPTATNAGLFWPRDGLKLRPGRAIVEFLDPIPADQSHETFLDTVSHRVEAASDALAEEAGFAPPRAKAG